MENKTKNNFNLLMMTPNWRLESIQEWRSFMKKSSTGNFKSIVGKLIMVLVLAVMIGSIGVMPAFGKDNRPGNQNKGRYEQRGHAYGHDRDGRRDYRRPYGYYGHRERTYYPPPPVFFAPPPPPGIGIFFPPIFIRP
jgi:hypothetical protein